MSNTKTFKDMTKVEKFTAISSIEGITEEMREFLTKEIESIRKKNSYKSKADKEKSAENVEIEGSIVDILASNGKAMTTTEIAIAVGNFLNKYLSTQKIVPRCKALVADGRIAVTIEKKITKYKVAE